MIDWFMDRYRGTGGFFGWMVRRADVRCMRRIANTAKEIQRRG